MKRRTFVAATAATAATMAAPSIQAQTLPAGPVRILVGFAPGGGTDILARIVAQKLQIMWGVTVLVENRAGATGVIAAEAVAKAAPDGNTLLMAHINSHALAPALMPKLNYVVDRDFTPLTLVGITPNLLISNNDQPAKTVAELVAQCKANPGKVSFGSAGQGSAQHMALESFKLAAGVDTIHIPYKGSGPMLADLIGGQIGYSFDTMTAATPHVKSGKVRAIAQTRAKRASSYPNVPTMVEAGFPNFEATTWYGLAGPGKMPPAMAQRMNEDINKVLLMPDVMEKLAQFGAEDGGGSAQRFADFIRSEQVKWAKVVKDSNVKLDS
ncbi:tripartite tricarboxylate transporter substrate binding protein [Limnohabitans sp. Rim28]|jgi:tripartite-type tricarboxylate transporter receptor subunit TctC|uniref:Bug family tripartite tricarboxylate transporter substrate binding protein n=1 Tax=Limnohabitans sp. Rim28 TaxID=1100720 RepID=UPI0002FD9D8C|nr:tripartite tricarboxylate transporter substrate binding protein [Limnohabitans sp. Rim28]PVE05982.1 LacI family transcriptional regulator [Limnohabitans sp. Rim28]